MKNKYIILALLPALFQGSLLYCDNIDINQMIMPQLQSAQATMKSKTPLILQPILDALLLFGSKDKLQAAQALNQMESIKAALMHHKQEEEYAWKNGGRTWWDWASDNKSQKVEEAIKPAIAQTDTALATLETQSKNLGYKTESFITSMNNTFQTWKAYATDLVNWILFSLKIIKAKNQILGTTTDLTSIMSLTNIASTKANEATSIKEIQDACKDLESLSNQVLIIGQANNINLPIKPNQLLSLLNR